MPNLIIENLILSIAITAGAFIYIAPLVKRRETYTSYIIAGALLFTSMLVTGQTLGNDLVQGYVKLVMELICLSAFVYALANTRINGALYVAIWILCTAQFPYSLYYILMELRLLWTLPFIGWLPSNITNVHVLLIGLYCIFYFLGSLTWVRWMPEEGAYSIGPRQLTSAVFIAVLFEFLFLSTVTSTYATNIASLWVANLLAQFYCLSILYVQTAFFKKSAIEKEFFAVEMIWQKHKSQYYLTKENIELINQKSHDLKHQVQLLRNVEDNDLKERYLQNIEQSVHIYDSIIHTGSEVLDTILTDKSLYCESMGIKINCVVDAGPLAFIDLIDLYSILGNAIDNAIEGVSRFKEKEKEKRLIDIAIFRRKEFLVITITNPVKDRLRFVNGLPVSLKANKDYHGYGLKSIRHNVRKYDGHFSVAIKNDCFVLRILLPIPQNSA